jgi:acyl-coenzyme A thioesterase PaaI-like protein
VSAEVTELLDQVLTVLTPHTAPMGEQLIGRLLDRPGRGQTLIPEYVIDDFDGVNLRGRIDFSAFYVGGNGAVHGGALPLLFDELMGWTGAYNRPRMRTAYLHVDFRSPAMLGHELAFHVWVDREEGRKVFVRGTLDDAGTRVADVNGLWIILRPGQV